MIRKFYIFSPTESFFSKRKKNQLSRKEKNKLIIKQINENDK